MKKFSILIGPGEFNGLTCDLDEPLPPREPEPETESTGNKEDREVKRLVIKTFLGLIVGALMISAGIGIFKLDWGSFVDCLAHSGRTAGGAVREIYRVTEMKHPARSEAAKVKDDDSRRVQLDLPPKAFERLQRLKAETEASTYAEVMKNALKLYAAAIEYQKEGDKFMIQNKDGTLAPLLIFG